MTRCIRCGNLFVPNWKAPNVCGNCYPKVGAERHKAGLSRIPKVDRKVREGREAGKKRFIEWYREEANSDDKFGKKIIVKRKNKRKEE